MPEKERYYFQHDHNARSDKKIAALVREYKSAGYGIYWCLAEMLHEDGGAIELDDLLIASISKDLNEDFELVKSVIEKCIKNFKLFVLTEDNVLTSNRVKRNLDKRKSISEVRSKSGKAGANAKQMLANAKQKQAKEIKGKEIKEKEIINNDFVGSGKESQKAFNTMPLPENFNGLPDIKVGATIELIKILKRVDVSKEQVKGLWEVFKIQNLTGKKYYGNENDVYTHFMNWSKTQTFSLSANEVGGVAAQRPKKWEEKTKEEQDAEVQRWLNEE